MLTNKIFMRKTKRGNILKVRNPRCFEVSCCLWSHKISVLLRILDCTWALSTRWYLVRQYTLYHLWASSTWQSFRSIARVSESEFPISALHCFGHKCGSGSNRCVWRRDFVQYHHPSYGSKWSQAQKFGRVQEITEYYFRSNASGVHIRQWTPQVSRVVNFMRFNVKLNEIVVF